MAEWSLCGWVTGSTVDTVAVDLTVWICNPHDSCWRPGLTLDACSTPK